MANTVAVPALRPCTYQGRSYVRGDVIHCAPVDALTLARRGDVTLTRGAMIRPKDLRPDPDAEPAQPEPVTVPPNVEPAPPSDPPDLEPQTEPDPVPVRAGRRYRRRDLQSEP